MNRISASWSTLKLRILVATDCVSVASKIVYSGTDHQSAASTTDPKERNRYDCAWHDHFLSHIVPLHFWGITLIVTLSVMKYAK